MPEEDRLSFLEALLPHGRDQRGHRLAGVRRIEKQRFGARGELDGLPRRGCRDAVPVADEPIVDLDRRSARECLLRRDVEIEDFADAARRSPAPAPESTPPDRPR